jgi:ABC-type branched-subunit amino acid transport system ATPase component
MAIWDNDPVLKVEHLTMRFGGLTAVSDLTFNAARKQITALIGPNGAGKTTVFNCITGFYKPTEGMIQLRHPGGKEFLLERMDDYIIAQKAKVARTFQNIRLFSGMTVLENLMVAQHNTLMTASLYGGRGSWQRPFPARRARGHRSLQVLAGKDQAHRPRRRSGGRSCLWRPAAAGNCPRHVHQTNPAVP